MQILRRVAALLSLAGSLACGCHSQEKTIRSEMPLTEEQMGVYSSFLDTFSALHFNNLANRTLRLDLSEVKQGSACLQGIELENLPELRRTTHPFGPKITEGRNLKLVDPLQQAELIEREEKSAKDKQVESEEASAAGRESDFLALSEIAFDKKHQFALLKYVVFCGSHCKHGAILVLEKDGTTWTAKSRRPCTMFVN